MSEFEINTSVQGLGARNASETLVRAKAGSPETPASKAQKVSAVEAVETEDTLRVNASEIVQESVSVERLQELVTRLKELMPSRDVTLKFSVDDVLNRPIIAVHDKETGKLVKQLPSEEVLRAVHNIDSLRGILFDDKS